MIAKSNPPHADFGLTLDYCFYESRENRIDKSAIRGILLQTNMIDIPLLADPSVKRAIYQNTNKLPDVAAIAVQMHEVARLNIKTEKPVWHTILSFQPGEDIPRSTKQAITRNFIHHFDCLDNQMVCFEHQDKAHQHLHLIINRIDFKGKNKVSLDDNYLQLNVFCADQEKRYNLKPSPRINALKTGEDLLPGRYQKAFLEIAIHESRAVADNPLDFDRQMTLRGYDVQWKGQGVRFTHQQTKQSWKGTELGTGFNGRTLRQTLEHDLLTPHTSARPMSRLDLFLLRLDEAAQKTQTVDEMLQYLEDKYNVFVVPDASVSNGQNESTTRWAYRVPDNGAETFLQDRSGNNLISSGEELQFRQQLIKMGQRLPTLIASVDSAIAASVTTDEVVHWLEGEAGYRVKEWTKPTEGQTSLPHLTDWDRPDLVMPLALAITPYQLQLSLEKTTVSLPSQPTPAKPLPTRSFRQDLERVLQTATHPAEFVSKLASEEGVDLVGFLGIEGIEKEPLLLKATATSDHLVRLSELGAAYTSDAIRQRLDHNARQHVIRDVRQSLAELLPTTNSLDGLLTQISKQKPYLSFIKTPFLLSESRPGGIQLQVKSALLPNPIVLDTYQIHPALTYPGMERFYKEKQNRETIEEVKTWTHHKLDQYQTVDQWLSNQKPTDPILIRVQKSTTSPTRKEIIFLHQQQNKEFKGKQIGAAYTLNALTDYMRGKEGFTLYTHVNRRIDDYLSQSTKQTLQPEVRPLNKLIDTLPDGRYSYRTLNHIIPFIPQQGDLLHETNLNRFSEQAARQRAIIYLNDSIRKLSTMSQGEKPRGILSDNQFVLKDTFNISVELVKEPNTTNDYQYTFMIPGLTRPIHQQVLGTHALNKLRALQPSVNGFAEKELMPQFGQPRRGITPQQSRQWATQLLRLRRSSTNANEFLYRMKTNTSLEGLMARDAAGQPVLLVREQSTKGYVDAKTLDTIFTGKAGVLAPNGLEAYFARKIELQREYEVKHREAPVKSPPSTEVDITSQIHQQNKPSVAKEMTPQSEIQPKIQGRTR